MQIVRPQPGFILAAVLTVLLIFDLMPHPNLERGFILSTLERLQAAWVRR